MLHVTPPAADRDLELEQISIEVAPPIRVRDSQGDRPTEPFDSLDLAER
jgi:hypothetical protein